MARSKNAGYGMHLMNLVASQVPTFGKIFVVCSSSDTALPHYQYLQDLMTPDNEGVVRFFTSLSDAYAACTDGNNDVILLDAKSNHVLTSGLAVSKSRVNFIGMD